MVFAARFEQGLRRSAGKAARWRCRVSLAMFLQTEAIDPGGVPRNADRLPRDQADRLKEL